MAFWRDSRELTLAERDREARWGRWGYGALLASTGFSSLMLVNATMFRPMMYRPWNHLVAAIAFGMAGYKIGTVAEDTQMWMMKQREAYSRLPAWLRARQATGGVADSEDGLDSFKRLQRLRRSILMEDTKRFKREIMAHRRAVVSGDEIEDTFSSHLLPLSLPEVTSKILCDFMDELIRQSGEEPNGEGAHSTDLMSIIEAYGAKYNHIESVQRFCERVNQLTTRVPVFDPEQPSSMGSTLNAVLAYVDDAETSTIDGTAHVPQPFASIVKYATSKSQEGLTLRGTLTNFPTFTSAASQLADVLNVQTPTENILKQRFELISAGPMAHATILTNELEERINKADWHKVKNVHLRQGMQAFIGKLRAEQRKVLTGESDEWRFYTQVCRAVSTSRQITQHLSNDTVNDSVIANALRALGGIFDDVQQTSQELEITSLDVADTLLACALSHKREQHGPAAGRIVAASIQSFYTAWSTLVGTAEVAYVQQLFGALKSEIDTVKDKAKSATSAAILDSILQAMNAAHDGSRFDARRMLGSRFGSAALPIDRSTAEYAALQRADAILAQSASQHIDNSLLGVAMAEWGWEYSK